MDTDTDNIRVYLDTSVISYLRQEDYPERTAATQRFWKELQTSEEFSVFLSDVTLAEIADCPEPKRSFLLEELHKIKFIRLTKNEAAEKLAQKIIEKKILTRKSLDDCHHIAVALLNSCRYIVSWNFRHLVNVKTINGIRKIADIEGFGPIDIITPEMLFDEQQGGQR